jgi:hypothetical protein
VWLKDWRQRFFLLTTPLTHSLTTPFIHSLTHSLTPLHPLISLTHYPHSLPHSLTHSPTHSLTHSLLCSVWLKDWRRRFFLLKGSKLFFAKSERAAPHGMVDLGACMTVKSAELKAGKRNAIEVLTHSLTQSLTPSLGITHSLGIAHSLTRYRSLNHSVSHNHSVSLTPSLGITHSITRYHSLHHSVSLNPSLTYTCTQSLTRYHYITHALIIPHNHYLTRHTHSPTHSLTHSLTCPQVSTADTTFFMYADTEKEKDEWIGAIGRAIVQASATFTTEDDRHSDADSEDSYNEGY